MTKFTGSEDPFHHLELFEQICEAFGDLNDDISILAFGLTLQGIASQWFHTIPVEHRATYTSLKQAFTIGFAPQGSKWSHALQLHRIQEYPNESVRDYIVRTKCLDSRCKADEKLSDQQLLGRFLEGLHSMRLHDYLLVKDPASFDQCCKWAIFLEDNLRELESYREPEHMPLATWSEPTPGHTWFNHHIHYPCPYWRALIKLTCFRQH